MRPPDNNDDEIDWVDDAYDSDGSVYDSSSFASRSEGDSYDSSLDNGDHQSDVSSDSSHPPNHDYLTRRERWHDEGGVAGFVSSLRRRASNRSNRSNSPSLGIDMNNDTGSESEGRLKRRHHRRGFAPSYFGLYYDRCPRLFNISSRVSTILLLISFLIWMHAHNHYSRQSPDPVFKRIPPRRGLTKEQIEELRKQRKKEGEKVLGTGAAQHDSFRGTVGGLFGKNNKKTKGSNGPEPLPRGCAAIEWQTKSFPTCNEIHEIDLLDELHLSRRTRNFNQDLDKGVGNKQRTGTGYVGSGLYRSVWKVDPRDEGKEINVHGEIEVPSVLKIMKGQQNFDGRNLDRHRRDALVMERLTASPNVVSIYGFCGNTLLTEYVGVSLDRVIYEAEDVGKKSPATDTKHRVHTRKTPLGRLHLALDVARGLAAAHGLEGPVLHADIQARQFLVDVDLGVKLNDFNRCRFMPRSTTKEEYCTVKIPSAPGAARAPEEYENLPLTQQIDVFSAANIFFGILTGKKVWDTYPASTVRSKVISGKIPPLPKDCCVCESDQGLVELMNQAYENDPKKRITSSQLVVELERLVREEEARNI